MPIKSYLAYPQQGKQKEFIHAVSTFEECTAYPADNKDVVLLVTDTKDESAEQDLKNKLDSVQMLNCLALVSAFNDQ